MICLFFTLVWLRVAVAATALLLVLRLLGQRMSRERHVWTSFFGMGLLNNVLLPFVLIVWGQHRIASGLASILNAAVIFCHFVMPQSFQPGGQWCSGADIGSSFSEIPKISPSVTTLR